MLLCSALSYGQLKKVELSQDEINFIAFPKVDSFGIDPKDFEKMVSINKTPFIFEVVYNNKVLYVGTIAKWYYKTSVFIDESLRAVLSLCLNYSDLSSDVILELLENSDWQTQKTDTGKKYICIKGHKIFNHVRGTNFEINDLLKDKIKIKIYKLIEE